MVFTTSYKPGDDPMLFLHGKRIPIVKEFKFLGVLFDSKLSWTPHIQAVCNSLIRLKCLFAIITKSALAHQQRYSSFSSKAWSAAR